MRPRYYVEAVTRSFETSPEKPAKPTLTGSAFETGFRSYTNVGWTGESGNPATHDMTDCEAVRGARGLCGSVAPKRTPIRRAAGDLKRLAPCSTRDTLLAETIDLDDAAPGALKACDIRVSLRFQPQALRRRRPQLRHNRLGPRLRDPSSARLPSDAPCAFPKAGPLGTAAARHAYAYSE